MKGYQMGNYKIRVKVEFVECDDPEQDSPMKQNDGSFEMSIDEADAISIDNCEKAVLMKRFVMHYLNICRRLQKKSPRKSESANSRY